MDGPLPGLASALPGAPGPAGAPRYRSIFLAARILFCRCRTPRPAVRDCLSLAPTRSWRGRGALQPPVRGAFYHLPGASCLVSWVRSRSAISGVPCISSGELISGCGAHSWAPTVQLYNY